MRRLMFAAVLGLFLAGQAFAGNPQWVQVKSPDFTVVTDAGEKRGREVALHFEQMRAVFGALFDKAKINSSQPMYIIAFRNTKEFRTVCPLWNGKPEELAGYFQQGNGVTYIALDSSTEDKWRVVFHEYGHFLLNSNVQDTPPWFDEGFAEYFSTVNIRGKDFIYGNIPEGDAQILQQYKWLPINQLFAVRHDSPYYNERNRQTIFYAESWLAFSHYWYHSPLQKQMVAFLQTEPQLGTDAALEKAFGMDVKSVDKEFRQFYATGRLGLYKIPMPPGIDSLPMTATPVDEIDARARVAELKLQLKDHHGEAVQEFEAILKEKPDHPVALRGLAYATLQQGDKEKASSYFRKVTTLQSDNPQIYYFSAMLLAQLGAQQNKDAAAEMQKDLERAVQLDPNFADAYGMLALAFTWQGKRDEAIAPAEKAALLSPRNMHWAMNLAGFYANVKRYDDAIKLANALKQSTDPQVAQQAATMYESLTRYKQQMADYEKWQKDSDGRVAVKEQVDETTTEASNGSPPVLRHRGQLSDDAVLTFFEGTLKQVSCDGSKATVVIAMPSKLLTLVAGDVQQVSFSGKRQFSCGLKDLKVKGFYKASRNELSALEFEDGAVGK